VPHGAPALINYRDAARFRSANRSDVRVRMRTISQKLTRCPACAIAGFTGLFILLIALRFLIDLGARHDAAIEAAKRSASDYAELLAEHTARTLEAVDRALREAELTRLSLMANGGADGPPAIGPANEALRHLQQSSPLLVSIGWTDAQGEFEAHSGGAMPSRHNLADTEHFIAQRDGRADGLFIAQPFRSVKGRWLVAASRRISNPDGSFAGIVSAVLDQSYFSGIYRTVRIGSHGFVAVFNRNGSSLVREPMDERAFLGNLTRNRLLTQYLPKSDAGAFEGTSPIDGSSRVLGYHAVAGLPLIVSVSYAKADVLEAWYRHLYTFGPLAVLVVAVFAFGAFLLIGQTRKVAKKNAILELTLENMLHGLCMFDASQRLTVCNRRYAEMYGFGPELTKPGTSLRSILEARAVNAEGAAATADYVDGRLEETARNEPFHVTDRLHDGRVISISHQPIREGGWVVIHQDITDRLRDEEQVTFMARHDLLTGVANRTSFLEKLDEAAARLRRRGECFTVFMLDLDRFKNVNDSFGHPVGDALLKELSRRLRALLRETEAIARFGGDEFAIIQPGEPNQHGAAVVVAERIVDGLTEPFDIGGKTVSIGVSVGIALAPADGVDPDTLMKKADLALYRAKEEGRNGYRFYDEQMTAAAELRRQMELDLRAAIAANEIGVCYQPIFEVKTRKMFGVEALARWHHPVKGEIPPAVFIPLAEQSGLIDKLGHMVLQKACAEAVNWPASIKVAVNISPLQFRKSNLLDVILCVLVDTGLPPQRLELEITETTLLANEADYLAVMHQLKKLGVSISLDDFGTGYSSLSYLTMFPFDKIKIDRSFTRDMTQRADCAAIVSSVLALAAGLDLATVAEGVENEQQFEILRASGVQFAQGFLFGQPCRSSELTFDDCWDGPQARQTLEDVGLENAGLEKVA
jgi:diguanylate cyclase (GGDEF)-like protein